MHFICYGICFLYAAVYVYCILWYMQCMLQYMNIVSYMHVVCCSICILYALVYEYCMLWYMHVVCYGYICTWFAMVYACCLLWLYAHDLLWYMHATCCGTWILYATVSMSYVDHQNPMILLAKLKKTSITQKC